ncbi:hypothetical protein LTR85_011669 [Meristemomyces frigidus]|nr:hypothetical protein LTR85_011669 [Meristemomyces frigidus]
MLDPRIDDELGNIDVLDDDDEDDQATGEADAVTDDIPVARQVPPTAEDAFLALCHELRRNLQQTLEAARHAAIPGWE